ncbi:hypothetical protein MMPV_005733 [Pyropia vietnamensis]
MATATNSRAATVNGYAALSSYIQKQATFVAGLAAAGVEPTASQLARFQSRTSSVVRRLTNGAPPPVTAVAEQLCDAVNAAEDAAGLGAAFGSALDEMRELSAAAGAATETEENENGDDDGGLQPTAEELSDFSLMAQRLWSLDVNRLVPDRDYQINVQRKARGMSPSSDSAREPFFTYVDTAAYSARPTFVAFFKLLDNYSAHTGVTEVLSSGEQEEIDVFLDAIMRTPVMRYATSYAMAHRVARSAADLRSQLLELWFAFYRREASKDSSAFEHVFLGEVSRGKVIGLHNWMTLLREERLGDLDYLGYLPPRPPPRNRRPDVPESSSQMVTVRFAWHGAVKPASTIFVGTSPEFEMALYSLLYLCGGGRERHVVVVGPHRVEIKVYMMGRVLGTCYASELPGDEEDAAVCIQSAFRAKRTQAPFRRHLQVKEARLEEAAAVTKGDEDVAAEPTAGATDEGQPPEETEGSASLKAIGKELFRQALQLF